MFSLISIVAQSDTMVSSTGPSDRRPPLGRV